MLGSVLLDLRYALRALRTNPAFAVVAILSLALGIGANAAIFSLINALMLRPLPVHNPDELVQVTMGKAEREWFSHPLWEQVRDRQDVFSGVFAYGRWRFNLAPGGEARYEQGHYVSGQFFETLGLGPALGRVLTPADDRRGCPGAAVLSHSLWRREYGGRPDILGHTISLNGHPIEIVGVAAPGFTGMDVGVSVGVIVPVCAESIIRTQPANILDINSMPGAKSIWGWLKIIGRVRPGVSPEQAAARLNSLAPEISRATPIPGRLELTFGARSTRNGQSDVRRTYRQALLVLLGISGMVLLIACANVASLLLARGVARQREIAIRRALGAGRGRLVRQVLTESLLLSCLGSLVGVLFARWGAQLPVAFLNVSLDLAPDGRILAFQIAVATVTGVLIGLAPPGEARDSKPLPGALPGSHRATCW